MSRGVIISNGIIGLILNILSNFFFSFFDISAKKNKNDNVKGMGVTQGINSILENLKEQPPAIHDLKLKVAGANIYEILNNGTRKVNPRNKGIALEPLFWGQITAKIIVYPNNTIHIDLGCTYNPYPYSYGGAKELRKSLEEIHQYILNQCQNNAQLIPVGKWIITQYHFGRDGKESLSGYSFEHTWEELEGAIMRFYTKHMPDGRIIPRFEEIRMPQRTVDEEVELMAKTQVHNTS